jgi:hypothetical protein
MDSKPSRHRPGKVEVPETLPEPSPWEAYRHRDAAIEQIRGTYRQLRDVGDPRYTDYPIEGVYCPTHIGYVPGHIGEDGEPLTVLLGPSGIGAYGQFQIYRPNLPGEAETIFYFCLSLEEVESVLDVLGPVIVAGSHVVYATPADLEAALVRYRVDDPAVLPS